MPNAYSGLAPARPAHGSLWACVHHEHDSGGPMREQRIAPLRMLAQLVAAVPRVLGQQRHIGGDEGAFLVANITGLASARFHTRILPSTSLHSTPPFCGPRSQVLSCR